LPMDTSVEAEYEDGFVLSETEHDDVSPYTGVNNILNDILERRPEVEHGKMIRLSCFYRDMRYDVDWTTLPDNARPIRFRDGANHFDPATGDHWSEWVGCRFGYQYNDENGRNFKEVHEL
jgi:hypothetical protein